MLPQLNEILIKGMVSFPYFHKNIFPLSFEGRYTEAPHTLNWATLLQSMKNVCIIAPRYHMKSTTIYSYLMWRILSNADRDYEILYLSYKKELAQYHIRHLKNFIERNPFFTDIIDLTPAESIVKYSLDNAHKFIIEPEGMLSFKRGRHPDEVIVDDPFQDPTTMLDLSVIQKINQRYWEDISNLPKVNGSGIKNIGTLQTTEDYLALLKNKKDYAWIMNPAIISELKKEVLWKEMWSFERLIQKKEEIGDKAFSKEFMLQPVYTAEAFFSAIQINSIINTNLGALTNLNTENDVIAGLDVGKKSNPSHFTVFEIINGVFVQRFQTFLDTTDYTEQIKKLLAWQERYGFNKCYFDNTRSELENYLEDRTLNNSIYIPCIFTLKNKNKLAVEFEKIVNQNKIQLLDDDRQKRQILNVTNDLESVDTVEGHGDSFWSIALALAGQLVEKGKVPVFQTPIDLREIDKENRLGLR